MERGFRLTKKFIDIDKIIFKDIELTKSEKELKKLMEEIPNFNKGDEMDKIVYRRKQFIILEVKDSKRKGYIIHNTNKPFSEGHTHLKSLDMAKVIINNVITRKVPKTKNEYLLISHIRISEEKRYINSIEKLIETRKNKSNQNYYNSNSKKV